MSSESIRRFKATLPRPLKMRSKPAKATPADAEDDSGPSKTDNRLWVTGRKFAFLSARIDAWKAASEINERPAFYDRITAVWIAMWGWDCPLEQDSAPANENPSDADIAQVLSSLQECSPAEVLRRQRLYSELRTHISRWFRHHGQKSLKGQKTDPVAKVLADFTQAAFKPPRRLSAFHYYLSTHYEAELKDAVDREYERLCAEAVQAGKNLPKKIAISNPIAVRAYEKKPEAFKKLMEEGAERDYQEKLARHQASSSKNKDPTTPEEYHQELEACQHWLSAFAEHVSRRVGMNVTILLAGPIGEKGGEIGVRCINVGKSKGLVPMVWPDFDQGTYNAVTKSMIKFAHTCFSADECRARALPGTISMEHTAASSSAPTPMHEQNSDPGSTYAAPPSLARPSTPSTSLPASEPFSALPNASSAPQPSSSPHHPRSPSTPRLKPTAPTLSPTTSLLAHAATRIQHARARSLSAAPTTPSPLRQSSIPFTRDDSPSPPRPPVSRRLSAPPTIGNIHPSDSDAEGESFEGLDGSGDAAMFVNPDEDFFAPLPSSVPRLLHDAVEQRNEGSVSAQPAGIVGPPSRRDECGSVPRPPAVVFLDDCSEDLKKIAGYLIGDGGWGPRWMQLVSAYVDIERQASFKPSGRLPKATEGRPPEVADWMKHARPLVDYQVNDIHAFGDQWWRWWRANQPAGRKTERHNLPSHRNDAGEPSWRQLAVTGPSGLVLFLLTAAWWGAAVISAEIEHQQAWLDAVEEMNHVFECIKQAVTASDTPGLSEVTPAASGRKRAGQNLDSSKVKRPRKA
ncbi:hypothetical protein FKP32DRAFT_1672416 [Trametes sanguinea]|nr:hypothetical protein FKP32DRAFT_1672416 [Trametes sanguinea]